MSYYIAPQSEGLMLGDLVIYRVVKRLKDFKAEDGKKYRVFKGTSSHIEHASSGCHNAPHPVHGTNITGVSSTQSLVSIRTSLQIQTLISLTSLLHHSK